MMEKYSAEFLTYLSQFVSENKLQRMDEVLNYRTHHITGVMENIFQSQNASAVIRTAECFGIQELHIIDNEQTFHLNPDVVVGSMKWIKLNKYRKRNENNTITCFNQLKKNGYRIVCTSPHKDDCEINELDINKKTALVFGNEGAGLSETAIQHADAFVKIPMFGFTESFNISVSAAICFHNVITRLHASEINWNLSEEEKIQIKIQWMKKVLKRFDLYVSEFFTKHGG